MSSETARFRPARNPGSSRWTLSGGLLMGKDGGSGLRQSVANQAQGIVVGAVNGRQFNERLPKGMVGRWGGN